MHTTDVQDWKIETRKRMSGKLEGKLYKVFIAPGGVKYYALGKAIEAGLKPDGTTDGRKGPRSKRK